MALLWTLAVLSLLPLLHAQPLACHINFTAPLTNATLDQISGKWFYIASALRDPEYKESARSIQATFFYFKPNYENDTFLLREYMTIKDQCVYNVSYLNIQRENGTLSKYEMGRENFGYLVLTEDPNIFMLAFFPKDKEHMGLTFYADKPEVTQDQMRQFQETVKCMGINTSEIMYTDEKKDKCGPLKKQHDEEKKEKDTPVVPRTDKK